MLKRGTLAEIARREGMLRLEGNRSMAGPAIEKYLAVFREAMNENGGYEKYSDLKVGYSWCCAFVYFCCLEAGFRFPPKPVRKYRWTLAAVPTWHHWASRASARFFFDRDGAPGGASPGDIVLFDRIMSDQELDHIGVVLEYSGSRLTTAEGGYHNQSGIFERQVDDTVRGFIRLPESS